MFVKIVAWKSFSFMTWEFLKNFHDVMQTANKSDDLNRDLLNAA